MQGGMKKLTIFDQFIASNSLSIHTKFSAGETKMWATVSENGGGRFFCTCGSNNWETVVDRQLTH